MPDEDTIAQLNQDITTADNLGDTATVERLKGELEKAKQAAATGDANTE
ncbi:hypothetical protein [Nocardia harenae]|nr:hypothetical protein [Nocardia harenae]